MKNLTPILFSLSLVLAIIGCNKDDDGGPTGPAPVASFTITGDTRTDQVVFFNNSSTEVDSFAWAFGDGGTSIMENPDHIYDRSDDFNVILVARQTSTGRTDTARQNLTIRPRSVSLSSFSIEAMPFTDSNGDDWDATSGPDVYTRLFRSGEQIWVYTVISNVLPTAIPLFLPLQPIHTNDDFSAQYELRVYDWDDDSPNQRIGTLQFSFDELAVEHNYPSFIILEGDPSTFRVGLQMQWH